MQRQGHFAYRLLALAIAAIPATYFLAPALGPTAAAASFLVVDGVMLALILRLVARLPVTLPDLRRAARELWHQARGMVRLGGNRA